MRDTYDVVVVGSGPAGQSAAELSAFLGHSVLLIERAQAGGVVTTTGGVPTKALRQVALALARDGATSPDDAGGAALARALDGMRANVQAICRSLQATVAAQIASRRIDLVEGTARLNAGLRLTVDAANGTSHDVAARAIVLAPGSRPAHIGGNDDPDVYDSDRVFTMARIPARLTVVGGGPVGLEFATVFTALGAAVTIVDHGTQLLPRMDGELTQRLTRELEARGVTVRLGAGVAGVGRESGVLTVRLEDGSAIASDAVLMATGRRPNTDGLNLGAAGVDVDARGRVVVDRYFQTTAAGIYAVGDVVAPTLASVAMQQGRVATCHALGLAFGVPMDRAASSAVYGLPELAGVGLTEEQARAGNVPYVVGRCDLAKTARGAIAGQGGLLKLVARADDRRLLGVHCLGEIASELVGMGHAVLHLGGSLDVFVTLALNTPTYSAAYRDAAIDAFAHLSALAGRPRPRLAAQPSESPFQSAASGGVR